MLAFLDEGYTWGSLVPKGWLYKAMGITEPRECKTIPEYERSTLQFLNQLEDFRSYLLVNHCMYLKSVHGEGYMVVKPEEQTRTAMKEFTDDLSKKLRKTVAALKHVEHGQLSDKEWEENQATIAKLAFFRRNTRKQLL